MTTKQMQEQNSQNGILPIYKEIGETPLQSLDRLRREHPEYKEVTLSYAGRLDPMASGLLLVLVGEQANKDRKKYLGLPKTYEVEVLFGVATDTFDILGKISQSRSHDADLSGYIKDVVMNISNFDEMEYPPYSSKPVLGKSLFQWAREGLLHKINIPKQKGKINSIILLDQSIYDASLLKKNILSSIDKVVGDFRQDEIIKDWNSFFERNKSDSLLVCKFKIACESGTYMRSFADKLGKLVDVPALALSIHRTKVGEYTLQ